MTTEGAALPANGMTPTEKTVMEIWSSLLPTPPSTVDDDFFDLGGQSLHLVHLQQRIHELYRIELPLADMFADVFSAARTAAAVERAVAAEEAMSELAERLEGMSPEKVDALIADTAQETE